MNTIQVSKEMYPVVSELNLCGLGCDRRLSRDERSSSYTDIATSVEKTAFPVAGICSFNAIRTSSSSNIFCLSNLMIKQSRQTSAKDGAASDGLSIQMVAPSHRRGSAKQEWDRLSQVSSYRSILTFSGSNHFLLTHPGARATLHYLIFVYIFTQVYRSLSQDRSTGWVGLVGVALPFKFPIHFSLCDRRRVKGDQNILAHVYYSKSHG